MTFELIVFAAGVLAGVLNAVAGGGSFVTFLALSGLGIPALPATATVAVAAWVGLAASAVRYLRVLEPFWRPVGMLCAIAATGGFAGTFLVLWLSTDAFSKLLPWVMLLGSTGLVIAPWLRSLGGARPEWRLGDARNLSGPRAFGLLTAGMITGFFNASGGVVTVALLNSFGMRDAQLLNGLKLLLGLIMTSASVVLFAVAGEILWRSSIIMTSGAVFGGYIGAIAAQKSSPTLLRGLLIVFSYASTILMFLQ